jgi:hypothetical protein
LLTDVPDESKSWPVWDDRNWRILLQKSFCLTEDKVSGAAGFCLAAALESGDVKLLGKRSEAGEACEQAEDLVRELFAAFDAVRTLIVDSGFWKRA